MPTFGAIRYIGLSAQFLQDKWPASFVTNNLKQRIARLLPNNNFARGVSVLVGGTASAQLVVLLAAPLLTRLYSPDDFGVLTVYIGILSLLSVIASLRYELAIPLPEDEREVVALTLLSFLIVLMVAGLSGILVLFWGQGLAELLQVPSLGDYLWLFPVGVLFAGSYQIFTYWAVRLKQFPVLAKTKLWQQLVTAALQIAAFKVGGIGLILGQVSGQGIGVSTLAKKIISRESWKNPPFAKMKFVAWRYRNFPLFSTWGGFLNAAGTQAPPLLFASVFGATAAGLYALAHRIIALPMTVLGQAVGQVFLSNAAIDFRAGKLPPLVISAQRALIKIILPPVLFLILFGPESFAIIFGERWIQSGEIASWLALWMLVSFSTSPLSSVFTVIERQALGMIMQAVLFLVRILGISVGVYYQDFMLGIIWFSIFNIFGYLAYQIVAFKSLGLRVKDVLKGYMFAFPVVFFVFLVKDQVTMPWSIYVFSGGAIISVLYYYKMMVILKND